MKQSNKFRYYLFISVSFYQSIEEKLLIFFFFTFEILNKKKKKTICSHIFVMNLNHLKIGKSSSLEFKIDYFNEIL